MNHEFQVAGWLEPRGQPLGVVASRCPRGGIRSDLEGKVTPGRECYPGIREARVLARG